MFPHVERVFHALASQSAPVVSGARRKITAKMRTAGIAMRPASTMASCGGVIDGG